MATNTGLSQARGLWVAFLDHDDVIAPHAFKVVRHVFEQNPGANFLYTDELVVDDTLRPTGLMLKPAYDPVLLTGVNYINHFSIYRRGRLQEIGNLRTGYDGSQDYDLLLRYLEGLPDDTILHLPYPAYWWRHNGRTYSRKFMNTATANARKALFERFALRQQPIRVEEALTETLHRVMFERMEASWPKVSIVIPSKDSLDLISRVLKDIFERTDYANFEVLVVDNGSSDQAVLDLYDRYRRTYPQFSASITPEPFNFSRSVNRGLSAATGEHYLILNNDVEIIEPNWLQEIGNRHCRRQAPLWKQQAPACQRGRRLRRAGGPLVHEQAQGIRWPDEQAACPQLDDLRDRGGHADFRRLRPRHRHIRQREFRGRP